MDGTRLVKGPPMYPVPPGDLSAPHFWSLLFTVVCAGFFVAAVVWVIRLALRGEMLGVVFLVGGLCMGLLEPYLDYLGLLWFAQDNVAVAVNLFGRHIPLYVVLGYSFFFGLQAYIIYRAIHVGKGPRFFLYAFALSWVFDAALQITGAQLGLYQYYGQQPFLLMGAPMWWYTIDATLQLTAGLIFFLLRYRLVGWGQLLVIPMLPGLYAGLNGALGWPVFTALNSNFTPAVNGNGSWLLVYLGGVATIVLAALLVWLVLGEISRAQRRAGIEIDPNATLRDVFLTKVGVAPDGWAGSASRVGAQTTS
ncbi:hypothetical protein ORI20_10445 [Mycobacterium sp. CVI_P3]|uniref:Uncharacterized protein n=1 Tax=Mycobacterium pinniadriaticum TaxID=2994102 RepID=A0ABT3SCK2_9MYCO|nr:hypothetical protein [Mycobacterium pinniadriaticum]MCX2930698.1 hypothetical protein [Mycobacterium pinniadriaticum]MCX2937122.1 hypothetical protein [Mycobacterium pinniadriaticum]